MTSSASVGFTHLGVEQQLRYTNKQQQQKNLQQCPFAWHKADKCISLHIVFGICKAAVSGFSGVFLHAVRLVQGALSVQPGMPLYELL